VKWFKREWTSDEEANRARSGYADHLNAIGAQLCNGAEEIASVNLHDALILGESMVGGTFNLRVLAGDLHRGYERVSFAYEDAVVDRTVGTAPDDGVSEILWDEIDLGRGDLFEHRILLVNDGELAIVFRRLLVQREPASATERLSAFRGHS
jgi:hypothetical protein